MNPSDLFEKLTAMADRRSQDEFLRQIASENPAIAQTLREMLSNFAPDDPFLETPAIEQLAQQENNSEFLEALEVKLQEPKRYERSDLALDFLTPSSTSEILGTLAGYEVYEILGYGGSGIVFRVLDPNLGKWFAIKVMHPDQVEDLVARKRFLQEARTLAKIDHENIVRIYRVEESPIPFLVMELIQGHSLDQVIERSGGIELEQFLSISIQIAQGLVIAHDQGIIHRDIKPSNILLTDTDPTIAKITDFGLARTQSDLRLTKTGSVVGTPWYMSPEQIRDEAIDARSDLFSLGCVMYEMLCGQKPFTGTNPYFVLDAIIDKSPGDILNTLHELPPYLERVVTKLLQKDPADRFQSANELVYALESHRRNDGSSDNRDRILCEKLIRSLSSSSLETTNSDNQINRFSEVKLIGLGATSVVFSALDRNRDSELVAIKMLRPSKSDDKIATKRIHEEFKNTSELSHPCIVKLFGIGGADSVPYIVEQFAELGSLAELLKSKPDFFTPRQTAWLVMKLAEALYEAHSVGILHRDIKSGNVLLVRTEDVQAGICPVSPLLSDFGISKKLVDHTTNCLTDTGEVLGTVAYMSPEQVQGHKFTTQSDLFSLGILLHEMLYRVHPFLASNDYLTRRNIVESNFQKAVNTTERVPNDLVAIVEKCLQKKPENRYASAKDLAVDLKNFLEGRPVSVSIPGLLQKVRSLVIQHPSIATFLGTVLSGLTIIIFLLGYEWQIQRSLARKQQEISQLFLSSIKANNSGINETILAGNRVDPTDLLSLLEQQIPLLEKALEIDPSNQKLLLNLHVMLHYASICNHTVAKTKGEENYEKRLHAAYETRMRSLRFNEVLLLRNPDDKTRLGARINGEYWMALLEDELKIPNQERRWGKQSIDHASEYLVTYPDDESIIEILNRSKVNLSIALQDQSPQESLDILRSCFDWNIKRFEENTAHANSLTSSVENLTDRAEILVRQARIQEAQEDFAQAEDLVANRYRTFQNNKNVRNVLISHYLERCLELYRFGYNDEVIPVAKRWREYILSHHDWENDANAGGFRQSTETHSLLATYYWWLGINRSEKTSESDKSRSLGELRDAIAKCKSKPKVDLQKMVQSLKNMNIPIEPLVELIAERY